MTEGRAIGQPRHQVAAEGEGWRCVDCDVWFPTWPPDTEPCPMPRERRAIGHGPIPVLTLWQPWATLVALGVKTIETRSWSTKHRGPLAIAAAARRISERQVGDYEIDWHPALGEFFMSDAAGLFHELPLGCIVATCTLVDVVLMVDDARARNCLDVRVGHPAAGMALRLDTRVDDTYPYLYEEAIIDVADQRPYGDFAPGRFAWLLDNVVALDEPLPFKGGQGLTRKVELHA